MPDDEIIRKKHIALFEYVMKHVQMRNMIKLWQNIFEKLPESVIMEKEHGYFYISNLLWYVDGQLSEKKRDELSGLMIEHLPKDDVVKLMRTIRDSYIEEGINKGITIGEARGRMDGINQRNVEIARRMLQEKTDIKFISSVTGLSTDDILKRKVL